MQAFTVEQVRAARAFLGWSQRELSEASGLSYETIHNFENSLNSATAQTLAAMRNAFQKSGVEFHKRGRRIGVTIMQPWNGGRGRAVTGELSRLLKIGDRVCWENSATDRGTVTENRWSGISIFWDDGHRRSSRHNDMTRVSYTLSKVDQMKLLQRVVEIIIYFGEMVFAPLLAVVLFETSTLTTGDAAVFAAAGILAWTLAEYAFHRFVLHRLAPTQHLIHHANPDRPVVSIFWQIWVCFAVVYMIAGGAFLAGSLVVYAWYLFVHHCTHHSVDRLPAFLIRNHKGHHKFATRNYGVTTTLWDHVFGTVMPP